MAANGTIVPTDDGLRAIEDALRRNGIAFRPHGERGVCIAVFPAFAVVANPPPPGNPCFAVTDLGISSYYSDIVTSYFCCSRSRCWATADDFIAHLAQWRSALDESMPTWQGQKLF